MIERQERTALLILLVILISCGIFAWVGEGVGKGPFARNYTSQSQEGELVSFQGIVQTVTHTATGENLILDLGGVTIFIPSPAAGMAEISQGDIIRVYGTVQIWKGKREILVKDPGDLTVLVGPQGKNLRS
nr:hypothetical protein [uncultured Methanospirillum sp.]